MTYQIISRCLSGIWKLFQSFGGILKLSLVFDLYSFLNWGALQVDQLDWDRKLTLLRRYHSFSDLILGWHDQTLKIGKDGILSEQAIDLQEFLYFECLVWKCFDFLANVSVAQSSRTCFKKSCGRPSHSGTMMSDVGCLQDFHILC